MANSDTVNKVEVEIPAGMSTEQYQKIIGTFFKTRDEGKKRDKAIQEATKSLRKKYPADYKGLLNTELKKVGLPVK